MIMKGKLPKYEIKPELVLRKFKDRDWEEEFFERRISPHNEPVATIVLSTECEETANKLFYSKEIHTFETRYLGQLVKFKIRYRTMDVEQERRNIPYQELVLKHVNGYLTQVPVERFHTEVIPVYYLNGEVLSYSYNQVTNFLKQADIASREALKEHIKLHKYLTEHNYSFEKHGDELIISLRRDKE